MAAAFSAACIRTLRAGGRCRFASEQAPRPKENFKSEESWLSVAPERPFSELTVAEKGLSMLECVCWERFVHARVRLFFTALHILGKTARFYI